MKCLVTDDSGVTRRILANTLRSLGFTTVVEASDGKQALELCDATFDLVISDWNMPGMGGVELVRALRANPELAKLPVLLVTARNVKEDVVEALDAGVNGYLIKPFTPDMLKAKIAELLTPDAATGTEG